MSTYVEVLRNFHQTNNLLIVSAKLAQQFGQLRDEVFCKIVPVCLKLSTLLGVELTLAGFATTWGRVLACCALDRARHDLDQSSFFFVVQCQLAWKGGELVKGC